MGLSASKQWNEMNEVNQALEETENQVKNSSSAEKKSFKNKLKSRILKSDPRSVSEDVDRTPIAVESKGTSGGACDTPVKTMALIDPRSPGCVLGGEVVVERTPILVMQKKEQEANDTPMRGSSIPHFSLPDTPDLILNDPDETETPISDSPLVLKTKTMKTSTPTTIPLTNNKAGQPSNLLQERLKVAASAALKDQEETVTSAAAAGEFHDDDLKVENDDSGLIDKTDNALALVSDNNESSLII